MDQPGEEPWRQLGRWQIESEYAGHQTLQLRLRFIEELARAVLAEREDLPESFRTDDDAYWRWLNTFGVRDFRLLRDLLVPIPPADVRMFTGSANELGFLQTGASSYELVHGIWKSQRPGIPMRRVYDFGSGPGRALRYFMRHATGADSGFVGTDVDERAIAWARQEFPFGQFEVNAKSPPLDFPDAAFDLIYAISVFSHLSLPNHLDWLRELRRVAAPRALLVLTTLGPHAMRRALTESAVFDLVHVRRGELEQANDELRGQGFAFIRQPEGHLDHDLYGVTFMDRGFVAREWGKLFHIVEIREAAIDDLQDAVVLERRA
jgi:SAM-dependent methyltransferase